MHYTLDYCPTGTLKPVSVSNAFWRFFHSEIQIMKDIADVSHFVLPDTPMDHEAAARGTTVYLVDKRIDMLPGLLGTNLCSLRPFVERLAFSVIWVEPYLIFSPRKSIHDLHNCRK